MNTKKTLALALTAALGCSLAGLAQADKLDDIIESGKLRCAVTLDFPPMGSRDAQNNPVGFDVDYCNDLAKALDVKAEIVETPFPDRIPALVSGRADVIVASTSDTLERAKTIGMSIPYFAFVKVVLTREDTGIASYEDLKGRPVGGTAGTFEALALEKDSKAGATPRAASAPTSPRPTPPWRSARGISTPRSSLPPSPPRGSSRASTRA